MSSGAATPRNEVYPSAPSTPTRPRGHGPGKIFLHQPGPAHLPSCFTITNKKHKMSGQFDLVAIGNPLLDMSVRDGEELLKKVSWH